MWFYDVSVQDKRDHTARASATAVGIHDRVSVNPMAFLGRTVFSQIESVSKLGVSFFGINARDLVRDLDAVAAVVENHSLHIAYLVHGIFSAVDDDATWEEESKKLLHTLSAAEKLGVPLVYCSSGSAGSLLFEDAAARLKQRFAPIVERAKSSGIEIAVENGLSLRTDCGFLFTLKDTLSVAREMGISICADLYPAYLEANLSETLRNAQQEGRLALVQISTRKHTTLSQPDRRVPGDGDLPINLLISLVAQSGYSGLFDLELLGPAIDAEGSDAALARGVHVLSGLLDQIL